MWAVGICERCGTVTAFKTTTPIAARLVKTKEYYCPICGLYKLLNIEAVPNANELEKLYNKLRVGVILNSNTESERYNASTETTNELIKRNKEYQQWRKQWFGNTDTETDHTK